MINLGDKVKDTVTGFKGIAIGRTTWLYGCTRIMVQPEGIDDNGKIYEASSFDEPQLKVLQARKVKEGDHITGGFDTKPHTKAFPSRR